MVDELKKVIEEYLNWLYPQPVEVLDIKDFRDYFEVKVKSEPGILRDGFIAVIYSRDLLDHILIHNPLNRAYKTYYLCQKFRNFIPEIKRLRLPRFSTDIPWASEKDMTMIKNLAKDLEKEWQVDLVINTTTCNVTLTIEL